MFIVGLSFVSFFLPVAIIMFSTYNKVTSNSGYQFANGFSEESVMAIIIVSMICVAIGVVLMVCGWGKRKNESRLKTIQNRSQQNNSRFCHTCNVNVSSSNKKCPICGNDLNGGF